MSTSLTLDTTRGDDGNHVLVAAGEIDLSNVDAFKEVLISATRASTSDSLTVDLQAVEYLDSAAINVLCTHADHIAKVIAHPLLMTVFTISGLSQLVIVEPAPVPAERDAAL